MAEVDGPYLNVAILCERVLIEGNGLFSPIRILDRMTVTRLPGTPTDTEPPPVSLTYMVMFRVGNVRGQHQVAVRLRTPSGLRQADITQTVLFEGDDERGVTTLVPMNLKLTEPGLYWFELLLDGDMVTKTPLRVVSLQGSVVTPPQL